MALGFAARGGPPFQGGGQGFAPLCPPLPVSGGRLGGPGEGEGGGGGPDGATGADAAAAIGPGLAKAALAIKVDGELRDLAAPLDDGAEIEIVTDKSDEALELLRHDAAHVLAEAVARPLAGGQDLHRPADRRRLLLRHRVPRGRHPADANLAKIEKAMAKHIKADEPFERRDLPVAEAIEKFRAEGQDYKVELIEDLVRDEGVETVSLYRNGPFEDLCRGPHGPSTGRIKAFKLNSLAGAYWRGDETRQMLTRIYGTAFFSKEDLEQHLERIEQAKARDHRKLGPAARPVHAARGGARDAVLAARRAPCCCA